MADNLLVLNAANATVSIRAIDLGNGTSYIMMSTPGTVGGTTVLTQSAATAGSWAMPVVISPNGVNPNGATTVANAAPVTVGLDQASIAVLDDTSKIANGNSSTLLTVNFTSIAISAPGTTTIVAAVASKQIRVVNLGVIVSTATNFFLMSAGSAIMGTASFTTNGGMVLPYSKVGWFQTTVGSALVGNSSATSNVGGSLAYITV